MDPLRTFGLPALTGLAVIVALLMQVGVFWGDYAIAGWIAAAAMLCISVTARTLRVGILVTALGSAASNAYLFYLKVVPQDGPAICSIDAVFDCESVNSSAVSAISLGSAPEVPITLLGLAFFVGLAVAAMPRQTEAPRFFQVSTLFAVFNVFVTLYLASVLFSEAKICLFCIAIYVGNAIILVASVVGLRMLKQSPLDVPDTFTSRSFLTITACFVGLVALGMGGIWVQSQPAESEDPVVDVNDPRPVSTSDFEGKIIEALKGVELDGTEPVYGRSDARYTIVEFADFGCPHCKDSTIQLKRVLQDVDDTRLLFKVFPLTSDCNPALAQSQGPGRCRAALAAECANQQGRFYEVAGAIFENQRSLAQPSADFPLGDLRFIAETQGLDLGAFDACMEDSQALEGVVGDAIAGARADIHGTPAMFVKGTHGDEWIEFMGTVTDLMRMLAAHRQGAQLPAPVPRPPRQ